MKKTLLVSARAYNVPQSQRRHQHVSYLNRELCSGAEVEVTDRTEGDETLCVLRDGTEVWINNSNL